MYIAPPMQSSEGTEDDLWCQGAVSKIYGTIVYNPCSPQSSSPGASTRKLSYIFRPPIMPKQQCHPRFRDTFGRCWLFCHICDTFGRLLTRHSWCRTFCLVLLSSHSSVSLYQIILVICLKNRRQHLILNQEVWWRQIVFVDLILWLVIYFFTASLGYFDDQWRKEEKLEKSILSWTY